MLIPFQAKKHEARQYPVIIHIEPDLWGFLQNKARSINSGNPSPTLVPAQITTLYAAGTTAGNALAGLPNNVVGFARAFVALRNAFAPKALLGYHISAW
jgi:hypothetical protein